MTVDVEECGNSHYKKGLAHFDRGDFKEAIEEFEKVLRSLDDVSEPVRKLASFHIGEAYTNLGMSHLKMKMYKRASEELKYAILVHPEYADLRFSLAVAYYEQGRYAEAESELRESVRINPRFAKALLYLGMTCLRDANDEGIGYVSRAAEVQPAYSGEKCNEAIRVYQTGNIRKAVSILEEVAETDVDHIGSLLNEAMRMMRKGDYSDAISFLIEAISACPNYADLRYHLGTCYLNLDMADLAGGQFTKALEINPDFFAARMGLATAYEMTGKMRRSVIEIGVDLRIDTGRHPDKKKNMRKAG